MIRLPGAGAVVRVAATIVFTALAGYASGHWSVRRDAGQSAGKTPPYLSVLALDVGESFSPLVLDNEFPAQEDG